MISAPLKCACGVRCRMTKCSGSLHAQTWLEFALLLLLCQASAAQDLTPRSSKRVAHKEAHQQRVELIQTRLGESGELISETNSYVQIETGLNYRNASGEWVSSQESFVSTNGWALAYQGQHKVALYHNLNAEGAVVLYTPDGKRMRSHVYGLAYYDPETGNSVLIGRVQDSEAEITAQNQVTYANAFSGMAADVRYTYTKAGFEQDIILWKQPPSPDSFGLNPKTTRLEVWTEFVETETPTRRTVRGTGASPMSEDATLADEDLSFGELGIGRGRSFLLNDDQRPVAHVGKSWIVSEEGAQFLVEAVSFGEVGKALQTLPHGNGASVSGPARGRLNASHPLPKRSRAINSADHRIPQRRPNRDVAASEAPTHGFVLDYLTVTTTQSNYTFAGDETYLVTGAVDLNGATTFEGGAVVKFASGGSGKLRIRGPASFETAPHRPVVFTVSTDNSVGQSVATGSPTVGVWGGQPALEFDALSSGQTYSLGNIIIRHAQTALSINGGSGHRLSGVQVSHCQTALNLQNCAARLYNALIWYGASANAGTKVAAGLGGASLDAQHLTVHGVESFLDAGFSGSVAVMNSLFVGVTTLNWQIPAGSATHVRVVDEDASPFGAFDGAKHYLSGGQGLRDSGSLALDPQLRAELAELTTAPPVELGSIVAGIYGPTVLRDKDTPDIGYHYAPVDYVCSGQATVAAAEHATFVDGAVIAVKGSFGLQIADSPYTSLKIVGRPDRMARILPAHLIQEDSYGGSGATSPTFFSVGSAAIHGRRIELRFVELIGCGRKVPLFLGTAAYAYNGVRIKATDCLLYNLNCTIGDYYQSVATPSMVELVNCCVERCSIDIKKSVVNYFGANYDSAALWSIYNSQFIGCRINLKYDDGIPAGFGNPGCYLKDCVFDGSTNQLTGTGLASFLRGNNARRSVVDVGSPSLVSGSTPDITLTSIKYARGPFGTRYLDPASTSLVNAGSRTAAAAGLAQHTVGVDQNKDSGQVDIGFHYVATEAYPASGAPVGVQGGNGWRYMYADKMGAVVGDLDYDALGNKWWRIAWPLGHNNHYTWITPTFMSPGQTVDSVRRFVIPKSGRVWVSGSASDLTQSCGDSTGVRVRIAQNGTTAMGWRTIPNVPGAIASMEGSLVVSVGDFLDFQLSNGVDNGCDNTGWLPTVIYSRPKDSDADGIADYEEDQNGDGVTTPGETSSLAADSDGDGLPDGIESSLGRSPTIPEVNLMTLTPAR